MALQEIVDAVTGRVAGAAAFTKVGKKFLAGADAPPRIVWVPTQDRFGPAKRVGQSGTVGRHLMTRHLGVEVHVWHKDIASVETLLHQLLAGIHLESSGSYKILDDAGWLAQSWANAGEVYVFHAEFDVPVLDTPKPSVPVTDFPQTNEMETTQYETGALGGGIGDGTVVDEDAG